MSSKDAVEIRITLEGEHARILRDLIKMGIAKNYKEAFSQALVAYYGEVLDRELKIHQVMETRAADPTREL